MKRAISSFSLALFLLGAGNAFAQQTCVGDCEPETPPAATLKFTEPRPVASIVEMLADQMGLSVNWEPSAPTATFVGNKKIQNLLSGIEELVAPHGYRVEPMGRTLHIRTGAADIPPRQVYQHESVPATASPDGGVGSGFASSMALMGAGVGSQIGGRQVSRRRSHPHQVEDVLG